MRAASQGRDGTRAAPSQGTGVHADAVPLVRMVVVNYDGGQMTLDCLRSIEGLDWPADRLDVVFVDNASIDGIVWEVREQFPRVRVIENLTNEGFARGCNLGMGDLEGVDYVALLNNDAVCAPDWLRQLVDALEQDPSLGAACGKMLLADPELGVRVEVLQPGLEDGRPRADEKLLRLSGIRIEGRDVWDLAWFSEGFHPEEARDRLEPRYRWIKRRGDVFLPPRLAAPDAPSTLVELRLMADVDTKVRLRSSTSEHETVVRDWPEWVEIHVPREPVDVLNSAGSELVEGGFGHDRGFQEMDLGQYDDPADVFAWCGGAVVLRARYLREVGRFDARFFLYYEDTELSWRGRLHGWRYRYIPEAVVRHRHAASTVEGSDLFRYWVDRNRLLMLVKVAPYRLVRSAAARYLLETVQIARDELAPLRHLRRPSLTYTPQRIRSLAGALRASPSMLRPRARLRPGTSRSLDLARWQVPR